MKIIVDTKDYNLQEEKRLLIPFIHDYTGLIGFVNKKGHVKIPHSYERVYDDFYHKEDVIRIALSDNEGKLVKTIISIDGKRLFKEYYKEIIMSVDRQRFVVLKSNGQWAVLDREEFEIVPLGKYDWIDGFRKGFARVKQGKITNGQTRKGKLWGIINTDGKEILPVAFPNIHSFVDELNDYTTFDKDYITIEFFEEEKVESMYVDGFFQPLPYPSRVRHVSFKTLESIYARLGLIGTHLVNEMRKEKEKYQKRIEEYNQSLPRLRDSIKKNMFNKPDYDPSGHYDYNKAAREQIDDAYDGQADAHWNTD